MANTITLSDVIHRLDILTAAVLSTKPVLTIEETAAFTGMSVSYLYKLTSNQLIPHYKPRNKMLYFDRVEIEAWLLQNKVNSVNEIEQSAASYIAGIKQHQARLPSGFGQSTKRR